MVFLSVSSMILITFSSIRSRCLHFTPPEKIRCIFCVFIVKTSSFAGFILRNTHIRCETRRFTAKSRRFTAKRIVLPQKHSVPNRFCVRTQ